MQDLRAKSIERRFAGHFSAGAVMGLPTAEMQELLASFAARREREDFKVAGAIEVPFTPEGVRGRLRALKTMPGGALFPVTRYLGQGSKACKLDGAGLAGACQAVLQAISAGADLVILSKFGKVEAEGAGFLDVFRAAAEVDIPCLTGLAPQFAGAFENYAGGYSKIIEASDSALDAWWASHIG
jgi:Protein of unknown function (DUF2478)